jgi:hypothetical protein
MVQSIAAFCQRVQAGLAQATFAQRRTLVELLIDRVLVANGDVEIRYAIPTHPRGEMTRFCQLRKDYWLIVSFGERGLDCAIQRSVISPAGGPSYFPRHTVVGSLHGAPIDAVGGRRTSCPRHGRPRPHP